MHQLSDSTPGYVYPIFHYSVLLVSCHMNKVNIMSKANNYWAFTTAICLVATWNFQLVISSWIKSILSLRFMSIYCQERPDKIAYQWGINRSWTGVRFAQKFNNDANATYQLIMLACHPWYNFIWNLNISTVQIENYLDLFAGSFKLSSSNFSCNWSSFTFSWI